MKSIAGVVFDMGRVLIELQGPPIKNEWLAEPIELLESWQRWGTSPLVRQFESGLLEANEFCRALVAEQGLLLSPEEFAVAFVQWPGAAYPGAYEALVKLRSRARVALYSNTSSLHIPVALERAGLQGLFDHEFYSFQTGFFKPDPAGFRHVAEVMALPPERLLFIDDNPHNVAGARSVGFNAEVAVGFDEARAVLRRYGFEDL